MSNVGQIEKKTQQRVVKLFLEKLGYDYLGDWTDRAGNRNIEPELLHAWLKKQGVNETLIVRALHVLEKVAGDTSKSLYDRNRAVYDLLAIPPLLTKWEAILGVQPAAWGIKRMKTKWGACNVDTKRIWLNLELGKKPVQRLEYIVVHEMMHLLERHHNDQFVSLMDRHLPHWRMHRQELNAAPLAHDTWNY